MQVYKLFFQVLRKQKGQIIMYLVIFLSVTLAAASQGGKTGEATFSPTTYKFAVMDADNSEISRALIAYLEQGNEKVHIEDKKEVIQDEIYNRSISCVLRIPSGFFESYLSGSENKKMEVIGVPGTIYKESFEQMITQYMNLVRGYIGGGFSVKEALAKAGKADEKTVDVNVLETGGKTTHSYVYYFFAYVPYILLCLCIVGISPVLVVLHKPQIRERIQCSSYSFAKTNHFGYFIGRIVVWNFISCVCRDWGKGKGVYRAGRITLLKPACIFDGGTWYCIFSWSGYEKGGDCQHGIKCHCIGNEFSVRRICAN